MCWLWLVAASSRQQENCLTSSLFLGILDSFLTHFITSAFPTFTNRSLIDARSLMMVRLTRKRLAAPISFGPFRPKRTARSSSTTSKSFNGSLRGSGAGRTYRALRERPVRTGQSTKGGKGVESCNAAGEWLDRRSLFLKGLSHQEAGHRQEGSLSDSRHYRCL